VELYLHYLNTTSWRGAQLKYRDNCLIFVLVWSQFLVKIIIIQFYFRILTYFKDYSLLCNCGNSLVTTGLYIIQCSGFLTFDHAISECKFVIGFE